jgi:hypothetical protein
MSFQDLKNIVKDKSFGDDSESKLKFYAKKHELIVIEHPMSLIYCCSRSDDVNDCIKLLVTISEFYNHETSQGASKDIITLIDYVMTSELSNIETIFESEKQFLKTILGTPLIFFKACNERVNFNKQQLELMLSYREQVDKKEISQYEASVDVGGVLVDKYVKNKA